MMQRTTSAPGARAAAEPAAVRERILSAAMGAFIEKGYAETSTLAIARRARVSKRELYALFGSKQAILTAGIAHRAARMRVPGNLPRPRTGQMLGALLRRFGSVLLREICAPEVIAVFRLAILEAARSPQVARALQAAGRQATRAAARTVLAQAQTDGLLGAGEPRVMTEQYLALLWGDLLMSVLLRLEEVPSTATLARRARRATNAFLRLYPPGTRS